MAAPSLVVQVGANIEGLRTQMTQAQGTLLSFQSAADKAGGRLMDLGQKGRDAEPHIGGLSSTLRTFDGALASMGIHIGPEIKALGELGEASGKAASQLGLVTTAGFAVAAGIGGWKIGRLIADFTGSDKAIGDWVAHALGWSDDLQRAGAKADVLALATKNAGHAITDFSEAVKINAAAAAAQSLAFGKTASAAHDTMVAVSGWQRELRQVRSDGHLEQLTKDLASQDFTLKELSVKYGTSVAALGYFQRAQKDTAEAAKKTTEAYEAQAKSLRDFYNWVGERVIDHEKDVQDALAKEAAALRAFYNEMGVLAMNAWTPEPIVDWIEKVDAAVDAATGVPAAVDPAVASVDTLGASAQQAAGGFLSMSAELYNAIRAAQAADAAFGQATSAGVLGWNPITGYGHRASGGPVSAGQPYMVGERGPELFVPGSSGSIVPNGAGGVNVAITINGSVLGSRHEIARVVGDAVMASLRRSGVRLPVGA